MIDFPNGKGTDKRVNFNLALNTPYLFKAQVTDRRNGSASIYRFKVWEYNDAEPAEWILESQVNIPPNVRDAVWFKS